MLIENLIRAIAEGGSAGAGDPSPASPEAARRRGWRRLDGLLQALAGGARDTPRFRSGALSGGERGEGVGPGALTR